MQTTIERSGLQLKGKTLQELTFQEFIYAISDYSRYPYEGFLRDETQESCCDFVGRFERLENDFDTVCTHLKIAGAQLPLTNTSAEMRTTSSYVDEYDSSSAQLIEQVFAREIKKYGYRFGPVFDETLV